MSQPEIPFLQNAHSLFFSRYFLKWQLLFEVCFKNKHFCSLGNFWIGINKLRNTGFYIFCFLITIFMANNWLSLQSNTLSQSRDSHYMASCLLLGKQKFSKKLSSKIRFTNCLSSSVLSSKLSQSPTWKKVSFMFPT